MEFKRFVSSLLDWQWLCFNYQLNCCSTLKNLPTSSLTTEDGQVSKLSWGTQAYLIAATVLTNDPAAHCCWFARFHCLQLLLLLPTCLLNWRAYRFEEGNWASNRFKSTSSVTTVAISFVWLALAAFAFSRLLVGTCLPALFFISDLPVMNTCPSCKTLSSIVEGPQRSDTLTESSPNTAFSISSIFQKFYTRVT